MSLAEKRHLYYGSSAGKDFSPYVPAGYSDSVRAILKNGTLFEADYIRPMAFSDSSLRAQPFDLRMLNYRIYAGKKPGNPEAVQSATARLRIIADAIMSTGNGRTIPTACRITEVAHEYSMLSIPGFGYGGSQSLVDGPCDYLTLKKNDDDLAGLYFNVSISFSVMSDMFKEVKPPKKEGLKEA